MNTPDAVTPAIAKARFDFKVARVADALAKALAKANAAMTANKEGA